jgi:hypothetical protein
LQRWLRKTASIAGLLFSNLTDETEPLAGNGSDQALLRPTVAHCLTDRRNAATERRFGDDTTIPHRSDQLILADHFPAVADKILQKIKHLGFDRNEIRPPPQLLQLDIK